MPASTPDAAALGRAVQAIRAEKGISQVQLSENTGLMQSWISNVEHGRRNPSWNNVTRLAEGLGVSVSELATRAETLAE
jgi:transcriptional regulator with XRE-family HTH domain